MDSASDRLNWQTANRTDLLMLVKGIEKISIAGQFAANRGLD
jgi:hypothetical protein